MALIEGHERRDERADASDLERLREDYERDGAVLLPGLLKGAALDDVLQAYEWSLANPSPGRQPHAGDPLQVVDTSHPDAAAAYAPLLMRSPLPKLLARLWGSRAVWFMYEQIWFKEGTSKRTLWHQDSPYLPVAGEHVGVAWMSFEPVSEADALEFCLGSHRGPCHNPPGMRQDDPGVPLYPAADYPPMPDVDAEPARWPIKGWATEPGDVVLFHPNMIHGGSAPGPGRRRRTLSLRFFGDDAVYVRRPVTPKVPRVAGLHDALADGQPFRHPAFLQVV